MHACHDDATEVKPNLVMKRVWAAQLKACMLHQATMANVLAAADVNRQVMNLPLQVVSIKHHYNIPYTNVTASERLGSRA